MRVNNTQARFCATKLLIIHPNNNKKKEKKERLALLNAHLRNINNCANFVNKISAIMELSPKIFTNQRLILYFK